MKQLSNVTLICIDCYNYGKAADAIYKSLKEIQPAAVKLLTDVSLPIKDIEVVLIDRIKSKEDYSNFCIKELYKYFDTDYALVIQHDGYVINGEAWEDEFLNYDYIGAPWLYTDGKNVGNGGFSLRSKKLCDALGKDPFIKATDPEDQAIGRLYRDYLIKEYGIKFPTDEVADRFSFELREPACKTFGFHGNFHPPYRETVIVKRSAALGDCIIMEPLLRHYAKNGYNVVVDIPLEYYTLYKAHYFPVKHISQFDKGRIPHKVVNLDMSYEVVPTQNYLKTYFEYAGIEDYELSRPQLFPLVDDRTKMFKKYCVVHIDNRETAHRNIFNVEWDKIKYYLQGKGFFVLQVGNGLSESCGERINTQGNLDLLKFIIAGCDLFIGVDSSPSHIAMAYNKPCVLFFGSVRPCYIHPDLNNTVVIQQPCDRAGCWHTIGGTSGVECYYDKEKPPCCVTNTPEVMGAIDDILGY